MSRPFERCFSMKVIWLASYPRSGNTWLGSLLSAYYFGSLEDWSESGRVVQEMHQYLAYGQKHNLTRQQVLEIMVRQTRKGTSHHGFHDQLMLKTHYLPEPDHPWFDLTSRIIHLMRHPKDVLLSAMNFHKFYRRFGGRSDAEYARAFINARGDPSWRDSGYGSWVEHARRWSTLDFPTLRVTYEQLRRDPVNNLCEVVRFLGSDPDPVRAERAAELTSLSRARELERSAREAGRFGQVDDSRSFVNRGATGQSLEGIEPSLDERFDAAFRDALVRWGFADSAEPVPARLRARNQ